MDADRENDVFEAHKKHQNKPYDESLDVLNSEEVASFGTPTPRETRPTTAGLGKLHSGTTSSGKTMSEKSTDLKNKTASALKPQTERPQSRLIPSLGQSPGQLGASNEEDSENASDSSQEDSQEDDDDSSESDALIGAYDAAEFSNLPVTSEIRDLFQYIGRYKPEVIDLDYLLKPFIPDYMPAVGDIDAFIKIPRPDGKPDTLGLTVLDEPCAKQSDPTVLDLHLRSLSKQHTTKAVTVKSLENAEKNPKAIQSWIDNLTELHRTKPPPTVHYAKYMPTIDNLMEEWPGEMEDLLKEVGLPTADLACDLTTYVDIICAMLDIPVHKSRIQSLHVLFTLFSEFKNSQHFRSLATENQPNKEKHQGKDPGNSDRLVL